MASQAPIAQVGREKSYQCCTRLVDGLQGHCFWPVVNAQGRAQSTTYRGFASGLLCIPRAAPSQPPHPRADGPKPLRVPFPPAAPPQQAASKSPFRSHSGVFMVFRKVLSEERAEIQQLHERVAVAVRELKPKFLRGINVPRPVTAQLTASILDALEAELEEVRIEKLEESVFYAVVKIRQGTKVKELDARPSDGLCIAALKGRPIYVAEALWEMVGRKCTDEEMARFGAGLRERTWLEKVPKVSPIIAADTAKGEGESQEVILAVMRERVQRDSLPEIVVGNVISFPPHNIPALLVDGIARFVGAVVEVEGRAGLQLEFRIPSAEEPIDEDVEVSLYVEMGRGWLSENLSEGAVVQFPQILGESFDLYVGGQLCARGQVVLQMGRKMSFEIIEVVAGK